MAVSKPSWLRSWLSKLNWDIFTWRVYIGDAIEGAIDWLLMVTNNALDFATLAFNKALDAWNKAVELGKELTTIVNKFRSEVFDRINVWWDELGEWWETKKQWVKKLLLASSDFLRGLINNLERGLASLTVAWDNFRKDTLPRLLDISWFTAWWGRRAASFGDWWNAARDHIFNRLETEVKPVRDEVNKHSSWLDLIKELFTDPLGFVLGLLLKVGRTYQNQLLKIFDKIMDALWG